MLENYRCKLSDYHNDEEAKRILLKKVRKEWAIREIVTQSEGYSCENIYEFEEGRNICFFVKNDTHLYYCGPLNLRRKKLNTYTLWIYDYCIYDNDKQILINDLSYIWDAVYSLCMPEQLICNPMVSVEKAEGVSTVHARKIYDSSEIKNIYLIDVLPSSDSIYRTYTITLYINGVMNHRVNNIRNFEPSINFPSRIYYQNPSGIMYVSCDYIDGWKCEICEYPESYHRKKTGIIFGFLCIGVEKMGNFRIIR